MCDVPLPYRPRRPHGTGSIRPHKNRWEGRWTDADGRPRSVSGATRAEVEAKLAECIAVARDVPTLAEWAALKAPKAPRQTARARYVAVALRQLASVAADVLALPTLPAHLRSDLAMTLAAAETALAEGEEAPAS